MILFAMKTLIIFVGLVCLITARPDEDPQQKSAGDAFVNNGLDQYNINFESLKEYATKVKEQVDKIIKSQEKDLDSKDVYVCYYSLQHLMDWIQKRTRYTNDYKVVDTMIRCKTDLLFANINLDSIGKNLEILTTLTNQEDKLVKYELIKYIKDKFIKNTSKAYEYINKLGEVGVKSSSNAVTEQKTDLKSFLIKGLDQLTLEDKSTLNENDNLDSFIDYASKTKELVDKITKSDEKSLNSKDVDNCLSRLNQMQDWLEKKSEYTHDIDIQNIIIRCKNELITSNYDLNYIANNVKKLRFLTKERDIKLTHNLIKIYQEFFLKEITSAFEYIL